MKLLFEILLLSHAAKYVAAAIESNLIKDEVVPDILDKAPNEMLRVFYNSKQVQYGEEWTPKQTAPIPKLEWDADSSSYYTLVLSGPDAPSRKKPTYREALMWLVTNIPGKDMSKGETLVEYVGAAPPEDGGIHRIVFTLYKQPSKITFDEYHVGNREFGYRLWWSQRHFAQKYKLGNPVAAMLFFSQFDDSVPQVHKEFYDSLNNH